MTAQERWLASIDRFNELQGARRLGHPVVFRDIVSTTLELCELCLTTDLWATVSIDFMPYLPLEHWPHLVDRAFEELDRNKDDEFAADLVRGAIEQCVAAVVPHIEAVWSYRDILWTGFALDAFRGLAVPQCEFLVDVLRNASSVQESVSAAAMLLGTRNQEAMAFVKACSSEYAPAWLHSVGFEESGDGFRRLYQERPLHLAYDARYLGALIAGDSFQRGQYTHPTWVTAEPSSATHRLGGLADGLCPACGAPNNNLLTLSPLPPECAITGLENLQIAACMTCLDRGETVSFQHDDAGCASPILSSGSSGTGGVVRQYAAPELRVGLADLGPRWAWQNSGLAGYPNLQRVGGYPSWVQPAEYRACPRCGRTMRFLLQMASYFDGQMEWGSGNGICYVEWCDNCRLSTLFMQST